MSGLKSYTCAKCGAVLSVDKLQGQLACPFCGNAIVFVDKVPEKQILRQLADFFQKDNIQVTPDHVLNNTALRHPNEPARHKLLDLLGDLYLLGVPLQAEIIASRPGHLANTSFAKKILSSEDFFVTFL